jgi:uncharacterized membrane protein YwzB
MAPVSRKKTQHSRMKRKNSKKKTDDDRMVSLFCYFSCVFFAGSMPIIFHVLFLTAKKNWALIKIASFLFVEKRGLNAGKNEGFKDVKKEESVQKHLLFLFSTKKHRNKISKFNKIVSLVFRSKIKRLK